MLFFGHIGITMGAARISRLGGIDYRMVLLGSLLPDIIDKPIFLLFGNSASLSGRDYAHTLLFNLILLAGGLLLARADKRWLLFLSLGSLAHLIFDQIWLNMETMLWPLLGALIRGDTSTLLSRIWSGLFTPGVYIPEIAGLTILGLFIYRIIKMRGIQRFLLTGNIG